MLDVAILAIFVPGESNITSSYPFISILKCALVNFELIISSHAHQNKAIIRKLSRRSVPSKQGYIRVMSDFVIAL